MPKMISVPADKVGVTWNTQGKIKPFTLTSTETVLLIGNNCPEAEKTVGFFTVTKL
jgi:hypothetical protein